MSNTYYHTGNLSILYFFCWNGLLVWRWKAHDRLWIISGANTALMRVRVSLEFITSFIRLSEVEIFEFKYIIGKSLKINFEMTFFGDRPKACDRYRFSLSARVQNLEKDTLIGFDPWTMSVGVLLHRDPKKFWSDTNLNLSTSLPRLWVPFWFHSISYRTIDYTFVRWMYNYFCVHIIIHFFVLQSERNFDLKPHCSINRFLLHFNFISIFLHLILILFWIQYCFRTVCFINVFALITRMDSVWIPRRVSQTGTRRSQRRFRPAKRRRWDCSRWRLTRRLPFASHSPGRLVDRMIMYWSLNIIVTPFLAPFLDESSQFVRILVGW